MVAPPLPTLQQISQIKKIYTMTSISPRTHPICNIATSSFGNTLEWFDFGLFIYLAPIIGEKFFPTHDPTTASIAAFGVFAAGFICRPLGGIFFGHLGDKLGRAKTLRWSVLGISLATLLVGFLPGYETIGITAAIAFTLLRMAQGLAVGGEYSGVMVYLGELAPKRKRGFIASFGVMGANFGFLLATLVAILLTTLMPTEVLNSWGWRIPFIFAGLMGFLILYNRLGMSETAAYLKVKKKHKINKAPLLNMIKKSPMKLIRITGLTCMGSTLYFVFFGYMPTHLSEQTTMSFPNAMIFQSILLLAMMLLIPIAGICGDVFGRKKMLLCAAIGIMTFTLPAFSLIQNGTIVAIFTALTIATIFSALEQGNTLTTAVENFPVAVRYTGVSFAYNMGNAIFGGTAPLIVSLLIQKVGSLAPACYLIFMACLSCLAIVSLPNKKTEEEQSSTSLVFE
jgi:MHS family proline/betaine transporter-like MFS transporter